MKERGTSDNLEFSQIMLNFIITDNKDMTKIRFVSTSFTVQKLNRFTIFLPLNHI